MSRHFTALGAPERLKPTCPGVDELIRQAEAKKLLDAMGDHVDNMGLNLAGTSIAQALPAINASVSEQATNIAAADQLLATGHAEQAGGFYQSALAKLGDSADDKQIRAYVDRRLRLVEMAKIYERTGEVDLTPVKDLTAWTVMRGSWKTDGDGLLGKSDDAGLLLALEFPTGKRWDRTGFMRTGRVARWGTRVCRWRSAEITPANPVERCDFGTCNSNACRTKRRTG